MKILHIITGLNMGGAENMLLKLLTQDDVNEHVVISLTSGGALLERYEKTNHPLISLNLPRGSFSFKAVKKLAEIIHTHSPDIIQGWMYHGNLAATMGKFLGFSKAKLYWNIRHSLHDIEKEKKSTALIIKLCGWLSFLPKKIIYNAYMSQVQHEKIHYKKSKSLLLSNGFDTDKFKPNATQKLHWRKKWNCDPGVKVYGLIARYHPMKDHETLLHSFADALKNNPNFKALLVMAGTDIDDHNQTLLSTIETLELEKHVILMGERSDIENIIPAFDFAVLPSAWGEGFSNFLGESMACGVPAIATNIGDNARILDDYGIIIPPQDSQKISQALIKMDEIDDDDYHRLSAACRLHIVNNFTIEQITKDYLSLYEQGIG